MTKEEQDKLVCSLQAKLKEAIKNEDEWEQELLRDDLLAASSLARLLKKGNYQ